MANAIEKIQSEHRDYARVLSCLSVAVTNLREYDSRWLTLQSHLLGAGFTPNSVMRILRQSIGLRSKSRGHEVRAKIPPNLDLMFSIVYYIRVFPDKFHHPKEERYLFKAVQNRSPATKEILDRLVCQHAAGERQINELDAALKAYEKHYPDGLEELAAVAEDFVAAQREHMRLEEEEVIPIAKAVLSEEDWREIDNAFAGNADPLFGENLETGFHSLHDHIVHGVKAA